MKFTRTELKYDIYGKEITMRKPTGLEMEDYRSKMAEHESKLSGMELLSENGKLLKSMLVLLGLPEELMKEMEEEHLTELVSDIFISKKK